jgi:hypothetical protein
MPSGALQKEEKKHFKNAHSLNIPEVSPIQQGH